MSVVVRSLDGEKTLDHRAAMPLSYVTDESVYRQRSREIYVAYRAGMSVSKIARKYRLSVGYTYHLIREIPEPEKERIDGFALSLG